MRQAPLHPAPAALGLAIAGLAVPSPAPAAPPTGLGRFGCWAPTAFIRIEFLSPPAASWLNRSTDRSARWPLRSPGWMTGPNSSTVLAAWDPLRFPVLDDRASNAVRGLTLTSTPGTLRYLEYLSIVKYLRDRLEAHRPRITARQVDQGLYILGDTSSVVDPPLTAQPTSPSNDAR
jgi:hypothetical protein